MLKWLRGLGAHKLKLQPALASELKTQALGASAVRVGRFTYGYENARVYQWGEGADLEIGSFCAISGGLRVYLGGNHRTDWATTYPFGAVFQKSLGRFDIPAQNHSKGDVVVGHDVWIGAGVTLLSGTRVGHGAVIGANATVAGEVAPYEVVVGNPAQHLKFRFDEAIRARLLELAWWDSPLDVIRRIAPMLSAPPDLEMLDRIEDAMRQAMR